MEVYVFLRCQIWLILSKKSLVMYKKKIFFSEN